MSFAGPLDGPTHPLLWPRLPGDAVVPPEPRTVEEALGMMERCHAASVALLPDEPATDGETVPLSRAWFAAVREACARTGPVPGVQRYLLEWWVSDPPAEGLNQLPWIFGVWQGHWVCWAGTTPWAAADQKVTTAWDRAAFEEAVRFGADPEHPPADPWTILGTSQLAIPTVILIALAGKPATGVVRMPVTPTPAVAPEPVPAAAPPPSADVLDGRIPPPPGAPGAVEAAAAGPEPEAEDGIADEPPTGDALPSEPADEPPAPEADAAAGPDVGEAVDEPPAVEAEPETPASAPEEMASEPEAVAPEPVAPEPVAPVAPIEEPAPSNLPPADWYPDPSGRHQLRYWDGQRWTEHAADQATGQVVDPI